MNVPPPQPVPAALPASSCPSLTSPVLPLARYRLRFVRRGPGKLPTFAGSAWRGALGHALLRLADPADYREIFETPVPEGATKMRAYRDAPHPFALVSSPDGETVELTLFGCGNHHAPLILRALAAAGEGGLGAAEVRLSLAETRHESPPASGYWLPLEANGSAPAAVAACPGAPARAQVALRTPLRLRKLEHYVRPAAFQFSDLFSAVLRRISLLTAFYSPTPFETDFGGLTERSRAVGLEQPRLRWHGWERYSSRQGKCVDMSGLLGDFAVTLSGNENLWPILWLGQFTQAGKGTSLGLGSYEVTTA